MVDTKNCQNDTVKGQKAFLIASIGQAKNLENFLKPLSETQRKTILEKPYLDEENDQFCPPLVIAARNGHFEVVKSLINKVSTGDPQLVRFLGLQQITLFGKQH